LEGSFAQSWFASNNITSTGLTSNAYNNGTNWIYKTTNAAQRYEMGQGVGDHRWFNAPSGTAGSAISFTQAMTLNASGNLGLGTSSPQNALVVSNSGAAGMEFVPSYTGLATGPAIYSYNRSGSTWTPQVYLATSHYWGFGSNPSADGVGMLLDTSGNLGLGVTPSAWASDWKVMQIGSRSAFAQYNGNNSAFVANNVYFAGSSGSNPTYINTASAGAYQVLGNYHYWYIAPSGTAGGTVTLTQAMTLDNSGNLLVGATSLSSGAGIRIYPSGTINYVVSGTTGYAAGFYTSGSTSTNAGSIYLNGTTTTYNTLSDQRLKTDLGQVTSTNVIDETIVHDFVWKSDGAQSRGVFAQEAHKIIPQAVKVGDDNEEVKDVWQVDYSKYVPDIIVYCQQLKAEIQSLKAEVATLKGA
jgi:hypothetical protein